MRKVPYRPYRVQLQFHGLKYSMLYGVLYGEKGTEVVTISYN